MAAPDDDRTQRLARLEAENAALRADRDAARAEQAATANLLRVISSAPTDLQRVLDTVTETAARLCEADQAVIARQAGGDDAMTIVAAFKIPYVLGSVLAGGVGALAATERRTVQVWGNIKEIARDYPEYAVRVRASGDVERAVLAAPLRRAGDVIGVIRLQRLVA